MTSVCTANMITVICMCIWLLPVTHSTDVPRGTIQSVSRNRKDVSRSSCYSMCDSRFSSSRSETWLACHHGCRFLTLLAQKANGKSHRNVKNSCLSGCTEAYNVTTQEKACHAGCGEQGRGKKKTVTDRPVTIGSKPTASAVPPKADSKMAIPSNIRFVWSKSIVDEQDLDSSSEDSAKIPESSFFDLKPDPFLILSRILPQSLLPQSVKITKSTVTYFGSKSLPSPPLTLNRKEMPSVATLSASPKLQESFQKQPEVTSVPSPLGEDLNLYDSLFIPRFPDRPTPEQKDQLSNMTQLTWKHYEGISLAEWSAIIVICVFFVFVFFTTLLRSALTEKNYLPLSTSDTKKDDAAGGRSSPCDEDSSDELLLGMRPPSYEQAQQDLQDEMLRPLFVSMGFAEPKHPNC